MKKYNTIYLYFAISNFSNTIQEALLHYMFALSLGVIIVLIIISTKKKYKDIMSASGKAPEIMPGGTEGAIGETTSA